jgi:hypothetical protein
MPAEMPEFQDGTANWDWIDETEFDESNDGTGASALLGANNKTSKFADFSRSKIRLAGYIGMPSTTIRGGTDVGESPEAVPRW